MNKISKQETKWRRNSTDVGILLKWKQVKNNSLEWKIGREKEEIVFLDKYEMMMIMMI